MKDTIWVRKLINDGDNEDHNNERSMMMNIIIMILYLMREPTRKGDRFSVGP